ncbi:activator-dependent family glycosyltransferase [Nonomuraea sp. SYSU D8015]|uniref:activator-dependent family glycosyltransferase n=1 Tax=Nonomuraea sp. SYSU D8015 TaxID=2593644 RepID=UPI0016612FD7|nr:activator-dependent family glycosyltransferase [Nonomuraea sp. SYSU D8015]
MRVMLATVAEHAHLLGLVPIGWALRTAGHEVRVASQPQLAEAIAASGLTAVPVGRDHDFWRVATTYSALDRLGAEAPLFGRVGGPPEGLSWEYLKEGYRRVVPWWWRMVNDSMIDDLARLCLEWRPDLVIWGPVTFAGALAAKVSGAAHARVVWGADKFALVRERFLRLLPLRPAHEREDLLAGWLGARLARYGHSYSEDLACGQLTLDCVPASLQLGVAGHRVPMRYVPYNGRAVVPRWLRVQPDRPRVALTLGISAAGRHGENVTLPDILDALSDLDLEVVATIPAGQRAMLGPVPDNARIVDFAPLEPLAQTCAAVIHHAGWGTLCTLLAVGVPQLMLPNLFDQPLLSTAIVRQGAGLAVPDGEVTAAGVREHLVRLLRERSFAAGAERLRDEALAMPTPNQVVAQLEQLALSGTRR